jgi:hypothetical protein
MTWFKEPEDDRPKKAVPAKGKTPPGKGPAKKK